MSPARPARPARLARCVALSALLVALTNARLSAAPVPVADSVFQIASRTGGPALAALRLRFELPVLGAVYDSTERIVVVKLAKHQPVETHSITTSGPQFSETLLAWDLATRTVLWSQSTTAELRFAARGVVVVHTSWGNEVLDLRTGTRRAQLPGRALIVRETGQLLNLENGRARGLTLPELQTGWEAEIDGPAKDVEVFSDGSQLFLMARKLTTVDLMTGQWWMFDASLRRPTTLADRFMSVRWEVTGLAAMPVRSGDDLFFAADSEAVSLHAHSGVARWRRTIDFDPREKARRKAMGIRVLSMRSPGWMLLGPGADDVAVVSCGYAYLNGAMAWADPPAIALLDRATGRWLTGSRIDTAKVVIDYVRVPGGHLLLCDYDRIARYDAQLRPQGRWSPEPKQLPLRLMLELGGALVVNSLTDAIELDPVTLTELRRFRIGASGAPSSRPGWCAGTEARLWFQPGEPQPRRLYPRRAQSWTDQDGVEVSRDGPDVTLLWLDPDGPGPTRE